MMQKQSEKAATQGSTPINPPTSTMEIDSEAIISLVTRAVNAITSRLNTLSTFEGTDSKVIIYFYIFY